MKYSVGIKVIQAFELNDIEAKNREEAVSKALELFNQDKEAYFDDSDTIVDDVYNDTLGAFE